MLEPTPDLPLDITKLKHIIHEESMRLGLRGISAEGESAFTLSLALSAAVKKVFYEKSSTTFSDEPRIEKRPITLFAQRMRVDAMEKFNNITVCSVLHFGAHEVDLEKKKYLITLVIYLETAFIPEFLRLLQYPYIDSENEDEVKDGCGTLANLIGGQYKKEISRLGYKDIMMSPPESHINTVADGVDVPLGLTEKYQISFEVEDVKRLVVELVTLDMLPT